MSKFKPGDVLMATCDIPSHYLHPGDSVRVHHLDTNDDLWVTNPTCVPGIGQCCIGSGHDFELVTSNGDKPMARRTFKLVKATPTHKAGTLFQEQCEDGTQPYSPMTEPGYLDNYTIADRSKVEDQPQWFVEVFKVTPEYLTQAELDQWDAFKKGQKPAKRTYAKRAKVAKK